jgi:hypothetical protein
VLTFARLRDTLSVSERCNDTICGADDPCGSSVKRETGARKSIVKTNTYNLKAGAAPATVSEREVSAICETGTHFATMCQ